MTRSSLVPEILQLILKSIHFTVMPGGRIELCNMSDISGNEFLSSKSPRLRSEMKQRSQSE